jgi:hypothetical protein
MLLPFRQHSQGLRGRRPGCAVSLTRNAAMADEVLLTRGTASGHRLGRSHLGQTKFGSDSGIASQRRVTDGQWLNLNYGK